MSTLEEHTNQQIAVVSAAIQALLPESEPLADILAESLVATLVATLVEMRATILRVEAERDALLEAAREFCATEPLELALKEAQDAYVAARASGNTARIKVAEQAYLLALRAEQHTEQQAD